MNLRIYSWEGKSLEWMSEYIRVGKIHEYLNKWIYSSINIRIYSNIRIFATHWIGGLIGLMGGLIGLMGGLIGLIGGLIGSIGGLIF